MALGSAIIDITMAYDISILCVFFVTKIHFGPIVGKYFLRVFCAGIGPLQLGVVLIFLLSF